MDTHSISVDPRVLLAAQAAHEVNRAYCIGIGDTSQKPWEQAEEWQKSSAIKGVLGVIDGNGPRESHESWLKEKRETGWVYGEVKDPEKKTHHCMVEYDELPTEQKRKDYLFVVTAKTLLHELGFFLELERERATPSTPWPGSTPNKRNDEG